MLQMYLRLQLQCSLILSVVRMKSILSITVMILLHVMVQAEADKPKAMLTAHGDTLLREPVVWPTLTCSVNDSDPDWTFEWCVEGSDYRHDFQGPQNITAKDVGKYRCKGVKIGRVFFELNQIQSDESDAVYVERLFSNKATVKVQNSEVLPGEPIIMTCQIDLLEYSWWWQYEWKTTSQISPPFGKDYEINSTSEAHSGDYWCRGRWQKYYVSEWSPPITVATIKPNASLGAGGSFLPAGGVVTLSCSVTPSSSGWKYYWYKDAQTTLLLTTDAAVLNISERGRYWCRGGRGSPVYYTHFSESISIQKIELSTIITGVVSVGVLLLLFLLIGLCWYKKTRERRQDSLAETGLEENAQNKLQQQLYTALLHSDVNVYESLHKNQ